MPSETHKMLLTVVAIVVAISMIITSFELRRRGMHRLETDLRAEFERQLKLPAISRMSDLVVEACILLPGIVLSIVLGPQWEDLTLLGLLAMLFLLLAVRKQWKAKKLLVPRDSRVLLLAGDFALLGTVAALVVLRVVDG